MNSKNNVWGCDDVFYCAIRVKCICSQKGSGTTTRLPRAGSPPRYSERSSLGGVVDNPRQLAVGRLGVDTGGSQQIHFVAGLSAGGGSARRDRLGGVNPSSDNCGIRFLIISIAHREYETTNTTRDI